MKNHLTVGQCAIVKEIGDRYLGWDNPAIEPAASESDRREHAARIIRLLARRGQFVKLSPHDAVVWSAPSIRSQQLYHGA